PAPFSPIRAWIVPLRTAKFTSLKAWTPGKDFEMFSIRRISLSLMLSAPALWSDGGRAEEHLPPSDYPIICYTGLLHIGFVVLRCHQFEGNPGVLLDGFAFGQCDGDFNATLPLSLRILEDGDIQPSFVHLLQGIRRGVHATDNDLAQFARGFDRLNGANRHFVIIGSDSVDLVAGGKPVLHQGQSLVTAPVAGVLSDDLDIRIFGKHLLFPF